MAGKTTVVDSVEGSTWSDLLDRLAALRLARDWSFRELATDMERVTGFEISHGTLQSMLSAAATDRSKPYDRTINKIRLYLAEVCAVDDAKGSRRRVTA